MIQISYLDFISLKDQHDLELSGAGRKDFQKALLKKSSSHWDMDDYSRKVEK